MEGKRQPPAMASAAVSNVLDDDNLLIEILLRVGFPTSLVRAALVCKRWLQHVSDTKFLRCFHKLHPPRLLGFYVSDVSEQNHPYFMQMLHQPPELAAIIRRARFRLYTSNDRTTRTYIKDCRNGRVFTEHHDRTGCTFGVHRPLSTERGMTTVQPFPWCQTGNSIFGIWQDLLSKENGDELPYLYVSIASTKNRKKIIARVYMLKDGFWRAHRTLASDLPSRPLRKPKPVLVDSKVYIPATLRNIIVLDFLVPSFSTIRLPQGVEYGATDTILSQAADVSSVYLIQVKEFQIRIWLHKGDNWLLVDTISMSEMIANLRIPDCTVEDGHTALLKIIKVGDNAEFVFFKMDRFILYLQIKCRTIRKVYELSEEDSFWGCTSIYPFMMIWPPIFPALKGDPTRNAK